MRHCFSVSFSLSLSLSSALSPSFVSPSQAAVTCKYGSNISPLNNTRSHEIYGCSRAPADLGVVRVYGPWELRMKTPKCLGHMKQRARGCRTKSPKYLGHMKLPSSSRAPYGLKKTREPVANPGPNRTP